MIADDVIGYVATGEVRPPRKGELFMSGHGEAQRAIVDFAYDHHPIMRPIPRGSVVIEPKLAKWLRWNYCGNTDAYSAPLRDLLVAIDAQTAPPKPVPAPCPECGGMPEGKDNRHVWRVECRCGVSGPWKPTEAEAVESWNRVAKGGGK